MFKNKKSVWIIEPLADVYVFIIFLLIMLIFTILFYFGAETVKTNIKGEYDNLDGNIILLNYLRTPVEVDGKKTNIAELILISAASEEHRSELKTLTQDLLNRLNIVSYEDDYSINIEFPDGSEFMGRVEVPLSRGNIFKFNKEAQREVGKIMLPSLDNDVYVSIYNYKGDVSISNFAKEAKIGDKIPSFDGMEYVYWGEDLFEYAWSSLGGAWAQEGWPCDTVVKEGKVFCKNGYKPTKDDVPCFVNGESFVKYNNRPPSVPEKCYKKDIDGNTISKTYSEENKVEKTEEIEDVCIKTTSKDFSSTIYRAKIGDCVISPRGVKWTNWGFEAGTLNTGRDYRWWSKEFICEDIEKHPSFLECKKICPKTHPIICVKDKSKFTREGKLKEMY